MLHANDIAAENKLRLVLLYALRYQKYTGNAVNQLVDMLLQNGVSESDAAVSAYELAISAKLTSFAARSRHAQCSRRRSETGRPVHEREFLLARQVSYERLEGEKAVVLPSKQANQRDTGHRECVYAAHSASRTNYRGIAARPVA